jgi:hypothetical protein
VHVPAAKSGQGLATHQNPLSSDTATEQWCECVCVLMCVWARMHEKESLCLFLATEAHCVWNVLGKPGVLLPHLGNGETPGRVARQQARQQGCVYACLIIE